jgi:hypothetical protein
MSNLLKSLNLTTLPEKRQADPVMEARNKLITRLECQKAMAADPQWTMEMKKWRKNKESGKRETVSEVGRPKSTWVVNGDGSVIFFVRKGQAKFVEFGKGGKTGIAVKSVSELPELISTLIAAVRNGELDEQLKAAKKH